MIMGVCGRKVTYFQRTGKNRGLFFEMNDNCKNICLFSRLNMRIAMLKRLTIPLFLSVMLMSCGGNVPSDIPDPTCMEDLFGYRVAVGRDNSYDMLLDNYPEITPVRVGGGEVLLAVQKGKADFGMMDRVSCLSADLLKYGLEPKFTGMRDIEYPMTFSRGSADLCEKFNEFLEYADSTGLLDRMREKWVNADESIHVIEDMDYPTEGKHMQVAAVGVLYPYVYYRGNELTGLQVDIFRNFSVWSGIPVDIKSYDAGAAIQELQLNRLDATFIPIEKSEENQRFAMFSLPYLHDTGMCFGRIKGYVDRDGFFDKVWDSIQNNLILEDRWTLMADGLWITVYVSLISILLATLVGALMCRMRMSGQGFSCKFAKAFVETIRSIPLLVLLMLLFYVVLAPLPLSAEGVAIVCFGLYFGAYMSETFRTGIESVDAGQWEAGASLGMKRFMTFRKVVLPQALLRIIPVYKGQMIALVKSTSIIGYVAIMDLTKASDMIRSRTFDAFFPLLLVAAVYLLLSWVFGIGLDIMERKLTPKSRKI